LSEELFDLCDFSIVLPKADIVVAADIMYEPVTGRALAHRTLEALKRGNRVIICDSPGRAGRPAFLEELKRLGVRGTFQDKMGQTCNGPRHDLICGKTSTSVSDLPKPLEIALMDLDPVLSLK
jgi:hypothetical protein